MISGILRKWSCLSEGLCTALQPNFATSDHVEATRDAVRVAVGLSLESAVSVQA